MDAVVVRGNWVMSDSKMSLSGIRKYLGGGGGISSKNSTLSVEFVGDGLLLGEIGWDESDCGGVSGTILSVSASENAGEGDREGGEGGS